MEKGFLFIGDVLDVNLEAGLNSEFEIIPGHVFKKASLDQIQQIKGALPVIPNYNSTPFTDMYEHEKNDVDDTWFTHEDKSKWRYWIVEYHMNQNIRDRNLEAALLLSKADLTSLFDMYSRRLTSNFTILFNFVDQNKPYFVNPKNIDTDDMLEIRDINCLIKNFKENIRDSYKYINKALTDFTNIPLIPLKTPFRIVSFFSIFESLLTHDPKRENWNNGTKQQLKTKLNQLNDRFEEKIDFRAYFSNLTHRATFKDIIGKLYSYRSDIAHGDFSDFNHDLQIISGHTEAYNFLYVLLKKTLLQSLKEPQLISDLKFC
ncbi:UNVERIFIED_CONTAM: hypothetical protein Cloal_1217 [Acetivibrio alkalicellulosi]